MNYLASRIIRGLEQTVLELLLAVIKLACKLEGSSQALTQNLTAKLSPNEARRGVFAHSAVN